MRDALEARCSQYYDILMTGAPSGRVLRWCNAPSRAITLGVPMSLIFLVVSDSQGGSAPVW